jgi:diguanylate cyclase (GGDEF)-like protein
MFRERLEAEIATLDDGARFAILYIDIDEFKSVNDTLGHAIGDELLKIVATRLRSCVGNAGFVARLGGDEFAIVHTGIARRSDVTHLVVPLYDAIRQPYECLGHQITTDASIGIAVAPDDGSDLDELLRHADLAMYSAKAAGRRTFRFFEPAMDEDAQGRGARWSRICGRRSRKTDLRFTINPSSISPATRLAVAKRCSAGGIQFAA